MIRNGSQQSVLVVDASHHVQTRKIETGLQGSNLVEVKSGLAEGDLVAFHSLFMLEPSKKLMLFISYNSAGGGEEINAG